MCWHRNSKYPHPCSEMGCADVDVCSDAAQAVWHLPYAAMCWHAYYSPAPGSAGVGLTSIVRSRALWGGCCELFGSPRPNPSVPRVIISIQGQKFILAQCVSPLALKQWSNCLFCIRFSQGLFLDELEDPQTDEQLARYQELYAGVSIFIIIILSNLVWLFCLFRTKL